MQPNPSFPELRGQRLLLRQFTDQDINKVYLGLSHPEVIRYYGVSYDSLEATLEQMKWFADLEASGTGIWWAVCSQEDGTFYGGGGLNDVSAEHKKAELGFWLLPDFWGNGYMKEGVNLILHHAKESMKLHRIEGFVESNNKNCQRGLEKLGFDYEGCMRECEIKDGDYLSVHIYSVLLDAWHSR